MHYVQPFGVQYKQAEVKLVVHAEQLIVSRKYILLTQVMQLEELHVWQLLYTWLQVKH